MEFLPLILDGILILILVASIFDGRRKGFVKTVLSLAVTVISIVIAKEFAPQLADWVNTNFIHDMGVKWLADLISDNITSGTQAVVAAIPQSIAEAVTAFANINVEALVSGVTDNAQITAVAEKIYNAAELAFINAFVTAVSFLVIFMVSKFILSMGASLINGIFKLPVLKGINKFLGGLAGALKGAIAVVIICTVLGMCTGIFADTPLYTAVNDSVITQFVIQLI
ncbi:MAG: CvpA family protein [Acutalibacteraceae bacterium]|nr:CvpA family protein [Acutalibacteraceae bacterium]